MPVLTKSAIWEKMADAEDRLLITPLLDNSQVGASSVDVRLGHQFIVLRRAAIPAIDPTSSMEHEVFQSQEKTRISLHDRFIIHPGQLVLGATLEYVSMPKAIAANVEGRSSWGRLGLIIATACSVAPGFKGCITLELVNGGEVPIVLYPGVRIAQLVFHTADGKSDYRDEQPKYDCAVGPEFTALHRDREIAFWGQRLT